MPPKKFIVSEQRMSQSRQSAVPAARGLFWINAGIFLTTFAILVLVTDMYGPTEGWIERLAQSVQPPEPSTTVVNDQLQSERQRAAEELARRMAEQIVRQREAQEQAATAERQRQAEEAAAATPRPKTLPRLTEEENFYTTVFVKGEDQGFSVLRRLADGAVITARAKCEGEAPGKGSNQLVDFALSVDPGNMRAITFQSDVYTGKINQLVKLPDNGTAYAQFALGVAKQTKNQAAQLLMCRVALLADPSNEAAAAHLATAERNGVQTDFHSLLRGYDSYIEAREEKAAAAVERSARSDTAGAAPATPAAVQTAGPVAVMADDMAQSFEDDHRGSLDVYKGKQIKITGIVTGMTRGMRGTTIVSIGGRRKISLVFSEEYTRRTKLFNEFSKYFDEYGARSANLRVSTELHPLLITATGDFERFSLSRGVAITNCKDFEWRSPNFRADDARIPVRDNR